MREWEIGAVENIHGALPYIRFAPILALVGVGVNRIGMEQWTGVIDNTMMRGFYFEGPLGPPTPLLENEVLIVLARSLDREWRRIVYTKELMHAFDEPEKKADSPDKFDLQIERISDPSADMSPQYRAEGKALWRALGVLCSAKMRAKFKEEIENGAMSEAVVAARLSIPELFVRTLAREDFGDVIERLM